MPLLYNKRQMLSCKLLRFRQLSDFEPLRLPQLHSLLDFENRLTTSTPDMNMYWAMLVAVKEKLVTIFLENLRHGKSLASLGTRRQALLMRHMVHTSPRIES